MNNFAIYSFKILGELIWEIIYFPIWWYSEGVAQTLRFLRNFLSGKEKSLAFLVWVKNIFTPMYGQYDWAGVLISFVVRFFQIIFRSIIMIFWLAIALAIFIVWLVLPVIVFYEIVFQIA